jgi:hypothetical protein
VVIISSSEFYDKERVYLATQENVHYGLKPIIMCVDVDDWYWDKGLLDIPEGVEKE